MTQRKLMANLLAAAMFLMFAGVEIAASQNSNDDSVRAIPGINSPDIFPLSCVDCHVKSSKRDFRISALMKGWTEEVDPHLLELARGVVPIGRVLKGIHPHVEKALDDVPLGCLKCHGKVSKIIPPFDHLMHVIHYSGEKNDFIESFGGECTHCHKFDREKGEWAIHSGPEK